MANGPALSKVKDKLKFRDSFSLLDVLYANEFEGRHLDPGVSEQTEINFYRGAPPNWLNFHISEQAKLNNGTGTPIIERDGYDTLKQQIKQRSKRPGTSTVKLFHQPGSGGTTLAMQVLWDLRKTFRCAVVTGPNLDVRDVPNVAEQVIHLFTAGSQGHQNTVLLLVNDEHILENLQDSIMKRIAEMQIKTHKHVAVLLSCVRKEEVLSGEHVSLKQALSDTEKQQFDTKKEELSRRFTDEHTQFYGFNIMHEPDPEDYVRQACTVFSEVPRRNRPKKTQFAAFLSLLNAYVPGSYLLESQCLDYLKRDRSTHEDSSLEDRMQPFSHLIVTFQQDERSERRVRMAHHMIAQQCIEQMAEAGVTRSDTARNFLTCFCREKVSPCLFGFVKDMLTKRENRANNSRETGEKKEKFSRLILNIQYREREGEEERRGKVMSASVLKVASKKFCEDAFFPQALSRVNYIELQKYGQAEMWARMAIKREPQNSFIADTLGQVHKNHLISEAKRTDQNLQPRQILQLASKAIKAFKKEEELAEKELGLEMKGDGMAKVSHDFNIRGQLGFLQVCNLLYDLLVDQNQIWREVLTKNVSFGSVLESLGDRKLHRFYDLIKHLRDNIERKCDFLHAFFTYSKPDMQKEDKKYIKEDVRSCYIKYTEHPLPELLHAIMSKFQSGVEVESLLSDVDSPEAALPKLKEIKNNCVCEGTDYYRSRYLCPLFYLGEDEAGRIVPRLMKDILQNTTTDFIDEMMKKDHIFRDLRVQKQLIRYHGEVRNYSIVIKAGHTEINVTANIRDKLWKPRPVSFYLGFTIGGLVAFGIQTSGATRNSESCCSNTESCGWTAVTPTPTTVANMYQLQSEAGRFQCEVSALRWVCTENVSFKYQLSSWETHAQMLDNVNCKQGGPLLNIKDIDGKIDEMYVPHWTCKDGPSPVSDKYAVLHEGDLGKFLEQVSDVTAAHVKIHHPNFSTHGVITRRAGFPMKVHCNVLIYETTKRPLTLHVYLIPRDPTLQKRIQQKETTSRLIQKPNPKKPFQVQDSFILTTNATNATVTPDAMQLNLDSTTPGCFTVSICDADLNFQLILQDALTDIWECTISRDE